MSTDQSTARVTPEMCQQARDLADDHSYREIGAELDISHRTVGPHVRGQCHHEHRDDGKPTGKYAGDCPICGSSVDSLTAHLRGGCDDAAQGAD